MGQHVNVWEKMFINSETLRTGNKTSAYLQAEQHTAHETETEKTVLKYMVKSIIKHQTSSVKTLLT
jgi:hypothetical protein